MPGCRIIFSAAVTAAAVLWAGLSHLPAAELDQSGPGYTAPQLQYTPEGNSIGSGKLNFYPEIEVGIGYDDNIFWEETEPASDEIAQVIPRVLIDYSLQDRGYVSLAYLGNFAFYNEFSDNDWQRNTFGFLLDYRAPSRLTLTVANSFIDTSDPFGSRDDYGRGLQKERWFNLFSARPGYNFHDRFKIIAYLNHNKQEYDNDEIDWSQNFAEEEFGIGLEKRVSQKTWGFTRYFHGSRDYNTPSPDDTVNETNDADYTTDRIFLGLTWDATSRITGELSFGYEWRGYDNEQDVNESPYIDNETWLAATSLDYSLKPGVTDLQFRLERGTFQRGSFTTELYDRTYLELMLQHRFYSWYKVRLNVGLGRNEYNVGRQDDDVRAGISLEYLLLRRWTLALGYEYANRDSDFTGESFTINRVLGSITLRY